MSRSLTLAINGKQNLKRHKVLLELAPYAFSNPDNKILRMSSPQSGDTGDEIRDSQMSQLITDIVLPSHCGMHSQYPTIGPGICWTCVHALHWRDY